LLQSLFRLKYIIQGTPVEVLPQWVTEKLRSVSAAAPACFYVFAITVQFIEPDRLDPLPAFPEAVFNRSDRPIVIEGAFRDSAVRENRCEVQAAGKARFPAVQSAAVAIPKELSSLFSSKVQFVMGFQSARYAGDIHCPVLYPNCPE
jgi:hypothetical protein